MLTQSILAKVEPGRLQTAVAGFVSGAYAVTITERSATELSGLVTTGEGPHYGVVLTADRAFCSCPDAMYRKGICKHAVVLALHVLRTPKTEAKVEAEVPAVETQPYNLKLGKVRPGWMACA